MGFDIYKPSLTIKFKEVVKLAETLFHVAEQAVSIEDRSNERESSEKELLQSLAASTA